jgi:hypothetical protein
MRLPVALAAGALLFIFASSPAAAQTRLTVAGGALLPLGDLGDTNDPSAHVAFRLEHQPVDALGRAGRLSFLVEAAWADLSFEDEVEQALIALGRETGGSLLLVGAALRAYSQVAPIFLSAGGGWGRHESDAESGSRDGVDLHAGIGFVLSSNAIFVEPLVAGHTVMMEGEDLQFVTATLGIGLPF